MSQQCKLQALPFIPCRCAGEQILDRGKEGFQKNRPRHG
jgi:hypothetical protein